MLPPTVLTIPRTELPMETIIGVLSYKKTREPKPERDLVKAEKDPKEAGLARKNIREN